MEDSWAKLFEISLFVVVGVVAAAVVVVEAVTILLSFVLLLFLTLLACTTALSRGWVGSLISLVGLVAF